MKCLIVDILFPNKFSKWRNTEIINFVEEFETDILVYKIGSFAGINLDFDWDIINVNGILNDYNILIFDSNYNELNKYNKRIDGTKYNNTSQGSYLITKNENFEINSYEFIYHIFLLCFNKFNHDYNYDLKKQFIHLYPGGGFFGDTNNISEQVNIISTNPITSNNLKTKNHPNYINLWIGTLMKKNESFYQKEFDLDKTLAICFSSLGHRSEKGLDDYLNIITSYKNIYPDDNIQFISIGHSVEYQNLINYPPMDYMSLDEFYKKNVDIYVNLSTNKSFNGWPLGMESLINGCVLITTDPNNISQQYELEEDSGIFIINDNRQCIDIIKQIHDNREILIINSNISQTNFEKYLKYENQQEKIFDFIIKTLTNNTNEKITYNWR